MKLYILMPCSLTHWKVVQSLHQFDHGIIILKKSNGVRRNKNVKNIEYGIRVICAKNVYVFFMIS